MIKQELEDDSLLFTSKEEATVHQELQRNSTVGVSSLPKMHSHKRSPCRMSLPPTWYGCILLSYCGYVRTTATKDHSKNQGHQAKTRTQQVKSISRDCNLFVLHVLFVVSILHQSNEWNHFKQYISNIFSTVLWSLVTRSTLGKVLCVILVLQLS